MHYTAILAAIDKELKRLQKLRAGLVKKEKTAKARAGNRRAGTTTKKAKRKLSPAGRARIAEAQRKRWAAAKKGTKRSPKA